VPVEHGVIARKSEDYHLKNTDGDADLGSMS
jgi:hypothetical protein